MDNGRLILDIRDRHEERLREEILANLNVALEISRKQGIKVDRYIALPSITNRSKHTVMSWFQREEKKIPLIDLCVIAEYLHYNIYSFFKTKENCIITEEEFLRENDECNRTHTRYGAKIFILAYNAQYNIDKDVLIDNVEKYYKSTEEIMSNHSSERMERITKICGCNKNTYRAWFNRSRKNVKIPLYSLCKLAIDADVDVFEFLNIKV